MSLCARKIRYNQKGLFMRIIPKSLYLFVLVSLLSSFVLSEAQSRGQAGVFDYYTMALSWSPTFCQSPAGANARQQCQSGRPYAFVLHGVWPQYDRGWPSNCYVRDSWIPKNVIRSMLDIMPSKKLIIHEWRKHGTCSGLSPREYFLMSRTLFNKIKIPARYIKPQRPIVVTPEQIETDFLKTNNKLRADMISIQCGRKKRLKELRICFDRQLNLTPCGTNENQRKLCRAKELVLPPVRPSRFRAKQISY